MCWFEEAVRCEGRIGEKKVQSPRKNREIIFSGLARNNNDEDGALQLKKIRLSLKALATLEKLTDRSGCQRQQRCKDRFVAGRKEQHTYCCKRHQYL